ncbi:MAG: hypothetical protein QW524_01430 [Candidatus Woesearchaeota archaeon]
MKLRTIAIILVLLGIILIITNRNYDLSEEKGRIQLIKDIGSWFLQIGKNVYDVTIYAIKKPWLPENVSINKTIETTKELIEKKNILNQTENLTNINNNYSINSEIDSTK